MRRVGSRCSTNTFSSVRHREARHFILSISSRTTISMWMGSPASTGFATFSHHVASNSRRDTQTTPHSSKPWTGSGTARTTWSTRPLKTRGSSLTREAFNSSVNSAATGSKSPSSPRQNCAAVLKAAKLDAFFDVRVDGNMILAQHLAGKPSPDTFLMGARLLGVEPARTVVIEDAISGVEAGAAGNFGLVIGVARKGNADELKHQGAHLVVKDLGELVD